MNILAVYNMQITVPRPNYSLIGTWPAAGGVELERAPSFPSGDTVFGWSLILSQFAFVSAFKEHPRNRKKLKSSLSPGLYPGLVSGEHYWQAIWL